MSLSLTMNGIPKELGDWTATCSDLGEDSNRLFRNIVWRDPAYRNADYTPDLLDRLATDAAVGVQPLEECSDDYLADLADVLPGDWVDEREVEIVTDAFSPTTSGSECGTVTSAIGGTLSVSAAGVDCDSAVAVMETYYHDDTVPAEGSSGSKAFDGWLCASKSAAGEAETGIGTTCNRGSELIVSHQTSCTFDFDSGQCTGWDPSTGFGVDRSDPTAVGNAYIRAWFDQDYQRIVYQRLGAEPPPHLEEAYRVPMGPIRCGPDLWASDFACILDGGDPNGIWWVVELRQHPDGWSVFQANYSLHN